MSSDYKRASARVLASVAEYREVVRKITSESSPSWAGGTLADARRMLERGDVDGAERALALVDKYAAQLSAMIPGAPERLASVYGPAVNVPSYLAGSPLSMWRNDVGELPSPVRVWFSICCRATWHAEQLRARRCAALALALSIARTRPVELLVGCGYVLDANKRSTHELWFRTALNDVSELAGVCSPVAVRQLFLDYFRPLQPPILYGHFAPCYLGLNDWRPCEFEAGDIWIPSGDVAPSDHVAEMAETYAQACADSLAHVA